MKLFLYRLFAFLSKPFVRLVLFRRRLKGLESPDKSRRQERFGHATAARPKGRVFWFNAASVGESNSIVPVIDRILEKYPDVTALVTTTTVTGAESISTKLAGKRGIHQFLPVDRRAYVDRFLGYWKPALGFFVDSDFWPNLMLSAKSLGVPLVLLNGRVSDRSFNRWMLHSPMIRKLMSAFIYVFGKSDDDRRKLLAMGAPVAVSVGNLKYGVPALSCDPGELAKMQASVGGRRTWVASSTHEGEEVLVASSHRAVMRSFPDALLVAAPRHPARGTQLKALFEAEGFKTALRSAGDKIDADTNVYVADTMGELGLFYTLSDIAFVGGSLLDTLSGHNPMEPARLKCAVLSGKNVSSFLETYDILVREEAVVMAEDEVDLGVHVVELLNDAELLARYSGKAYEVAEREAAVLDRTMDKLQSILDSVK
ncbi:MAG: 3-deoxy-D-manno-octulosonic acid transferase [Rickettsiales bacterium]|jgi:3-deoxy-D-manno-octulosonic-acid transferase|nr:3-deoxy-D-manno-octulosonic acid transferase [Rickettsiales bacterium]